MKTGLIILNIFFSAVAFASERTLADEDIENIMGMVRSASRSTTDIIRDYRTRKGMTHEEWIGAVSNYAVSVQSPYQLTLAAYVIARIDYESETNPIPFLEFMLNEATDPTLRSAAIFPYIRRNGKEWKELAMAELERPNATWRSRETIFKAILRLAETLDEQGREGIRDWLTPILFDKRSSGHRSLLDNRLIDLCPEWIASETRRRALEAWIQDSRDEEESSYWAGLLDRVQRGDYSSPYPKLPETPVAWPPVIKHINPIPMITEKRAATVAREHLQANLYARVSSVQLDEEKKVYVVRLTSEKTPQTMYIVTIDAYRGLVSDIHTEDVDTHQEQQP